MSPLLPQQFLKHMEIPSLRGVFILGSFEQRVTLYSQQVRALNLAFSLAEVQRLTPGAKVLVIGGGAAGLTFAAGAARLGAEVTLLERRGEVLSTFQGNDTRWLHPHVYEWPSPGSENKDAELPLMTWSTDLAGAVARTLLDQWHALKAEHGIHVFCHAKNIQPAPGSKDEHEFTWHAQGFHSDAFVIVVFAVGFGEEKQFPGAETPSYWEDDALHQHVSSPDTRFLVSGIGDGGVVDLLRLRFKGFQHDHIVRELLEDSELEPVKSALLGIEQDLQQRGLSARELYQRYENLEVPESLHQRIRERLRDDTHVVLNSPEPYPVSPKASILNRFLLSRLLRVEGLEYRPGAITCVEPQKGGAYRVSFEAGPPASFHRVIIRHGARSTLEQDFPQIWQEASSHLRSINTLDESREPLWAKETFAPKRSQATVNSRATPTTSLSKPAPIIGRKQEVQQIINAILAPTPSPVVVLGPPGIGKSTVARAALQDEEAERHYGKRRFFVRLDGADTVETVSARVAQEIRATSLSDSMAGIQAELDRAPTLLVLDNADTLRQSDPSGMEEFLQVLARKPTLALITTLRGKTRPDFGGSPSLVVKVGPLTLEESRELFCSIAYDIRPDQPGLSELLEELEGVALAVKLLARQAEGVDFDTTLQRWKSERTEMLQSGTDPGSNLAISIELSLKSPELTPEAIQLLSILSLLPAGMAVADRGSIIPESTAAIARLQKAALVEKEKEEDRWRLLMVIREHIRKHRPPRAEDRKKTLDFYFSLAQRRGPQIGKPHGSEALDRLSEEIDNIEELLLEQPEGEDAETVIATALQLSDFIRFSGRGSARPLERARMLAKQQGQPLKEAQCLLALGRLHLLRKARYNLARQCLDEAMRLCKKAGDQRAEADCLRELGHTATNEYELEQTDEAKLNEAERCFQQSLTMQQQFQDPIGKAYCFHGLARVRRFQNEPEEARDLFRKALQMFLEQEDLLGEAYSLRHLGTQEEDEKSLLKACEIFSHTGEQRNLAHCQHTLGDIALKRGQPLEAEERCKSALELFLRLQAIREAAWCRISLARVLHARSALNEARELLDQACAAARKHKDKRCEAECEHLLREWE
ncbi:MAG: FAD-dependent oxidoreductase [Hyalangium sp.]|uniref:FAD-dependent oxidoreductase n=1 Tax=Hyalangium sp. TaxID=2028555 RepID=UPI00389AFE3C